MEALMIGGSWWVTALVYGLSLVTAAVLVAYRVQIVRFIREVRVELGKCTWPWDPEQTGFRKYKVLIDTTLIICVATLLMAGYITGFDFAINKLVGWLVNF
ncbi:MAG: preprotein translocase subunit SecE [Blastochloris sp.]|nr:preprotein translocase subunit SecE [Blastochloris sp.]